MKYMRNMKSKKETLETLLRNKEAVRDPIPLKKIPPSKVPLEEV